MRRFIISLSSMLFLASCRVQVEPLAVGDLPAPVVQVSTITPRPTIALTATPEPTLTPLPVTAVDITAQTTTAGPPASITEASATAAATPAATLQATLQANAQPAVEAPNSIGVPAPTAPAAGVGFHTYGSPIVLANYMPWYNPDSWATCTADSPAAGPYQSSDAATISRQIAEARAAAIDGFAVHWGGPGDITDANLKQVLGQGYGATVTFLNHFFYGIAPRSQVIGALQTVIGYASSYSSWVRYNGKPLIIFADMGRIDTGGGLTEVQAWAEIRNAVDPGHTTIWMAEGLDPAYMQVFDGLYVYRIDHACCPAAYQNAGKWAGWVRDYEQRYGPRYWMATIQPGWDDSRTIDEACNGVRLSAEPFARDRENGAYYDRSFNAALGSTPDMLLVHSFNEWVEGSTIEPSAGYGNLYLDKTAQLVAQFKASR